MMVGERLRRELFPGCGDESPRCPVGIAGEPCGEIASMLLPVETPIGIKLDLPVCEQHFKDFNEEVFPL